MRTLALAALLSAFPAVAQAGDLFIPELKIAPASTGYVVVSATIENQGTTSATFYVDAYANRAAAGVGDKYTKLTLAGGATTTVSFQVKASTSVAVAVDISGKVVEEDEKNNLLMYQFALPNPVEIMQLDACDISGESSCDDDGVELDCSKVQVSTGSNLLIGYLNGPTNPLLEAGIDFVYACE
jgi:hypothetical protein